MAEDAAPRLDAPPRLDALWGEVVRARVVVAAERHDPRRQVAPTARIALVCALEAYLGNIAERGYPAPYLLVNELHTQRLACL